MSNDVLGWEGARVCCVPTCDKMKLFKSDHAAHAAGWRYLGFVTSHTKGFAMVCKKHQGEFQKIVLQQIMMNVKAELEK